MSPKQYLQTKRLDLAQRLIQQPDLTVKEITSMCGFNSEAYFSRLFHQVFGKSPSAYRLVNSEREGQPSPRSFSAKSINSNGKGQV